MNFRYRMHPRTGLYILFFLIVYLVLALWVSYIIFPQYFAGTEPLPLDVLANPSLEKIAAERHDFHMKYLLFCVFSVLAALGSYVFFNFVCINNYEAFCIYRHQWRRSHILSHMALLFTVWHGFFTLPNSFQKVINSLFVIILIWSALQWPVAYLKKKLTRIRRKAWDGPTLGSWTKFFAFVDFIANVIAVIIDFSMGNALIGFLSAFPKLAAFLPAPRPEQAYRIVILPQALIALIPLLPLFMLCIWCRFALPRSLGVGPTSQTRSSFISFEKYRSHI